VFTSHKAWESSNNFVIRTNLLTANMPSYAILGATGNTGLAVLQVLLQSPSNQIRTYCRSKERLFRKCPAAANLDNVHVFEGNLDNEPLIADCIRGTRAVFLTVAIVDNMPGCTVARDTACVVLAALEKIRGELEAVARASGNPLSEEDLKKKLPSLIVLSSASLEDSFCSDVPAFAHWILNKAVSHLYKDLAEQEKLLRNQEKWLSSVFVKPGGLVHDRQSGHQISTETAKTPLSYLDLAAGMIEVADADGEYDMKNVSVLPTGDDVPFPWPGVYFAFTGLLFHFMPWTYRYIGEYPPTR